MSQGEKKASPILPTANEIAERLGEIKAEEKALRALLRVMGWKSEEKVKPDEVDEEPPAE